MPAKADQQLIDYFFAAAKTGQVEVLDTFLDQGFPVNQRNNQSYTALMMATYHGQKPWGQRLPERQAGPYRHDGRRCQSGMGHRQNAVSKRLPPGPFYGKNTGRICQNIRPDRKAEGPAGGPGIGSGTGPPAERNYKSSRVSLLRRGSPNR